LEKTDHAVSTAHFLVKYDFQQQDIQSSFSWWPNAIKEAREEEGLNIISAQLFHSLKYSYLTLKNAENTHKFGRWAGMTS
jgi:hypothetical protein